MCEISGNNRCQLEVPISLIVTGSVAAIKTLSLLKALAAKGYRADVILTRGPQVWGWIGTSEIRQATNGQVWDAASDMHAAADNLRRAQIVLAAPSSANFLSRLAFNSSALARSVRAAKRSGAALFLAPAMNIKMWSHPAVQRNCRTLSDEGCLFLGPVDGAMACGDHGFGRMIGVTEMVEAIDALMAGKSHSSLSYYEAAARGQAASAPRRLADLEIDILVVLTGKPVFEKLERLISFLGNMPLRRVFVADGEWAAHKERIETLTHTTVVIDHYQIPAYEGMEHIRLPEKSGCLFFPFLDGVTAEHMTQGANASLALDMYLASKAPVVTSRQALQQLPKAIADILEKDGVTSFESLQGPTKFPSNAFVSLHL